MFTVADDIDPGDLLIVQGHPSRVVHGVGQQIAREDPIRAPPMNLFTRLVERYLFHQPSWLRHGSHDRGEKWFRHSDLHPVDWSSLNVSALTASSSSWLVGGARAGTPKLAQPGERQRLTWIGLPRDPGESGFRAGIGPIPGNSTTRERPTARFKCVRVFPYPRIRRPKMVGPPGLEVSCYFNGLGRPTPENRGFDNKGKKFPFVQPAGCVDAG